MKSSANIRLKAALIAVVAAAGMCLHADDMGYTTNCYEVVAGDVVMTSGKGGVYPSGLVIGTVESIALDPAGLSSSGVVRPSADIPAVTGLFVITDYLPED